MTDPNTAATAVFGSVFVDIKGYPDNLYNPFGRNIGKVKYIHGGVARNVAENIARLNGSVRFISSVDCTAMGHDVRARLEKDGVDVSHVVEAENGMGLWLAVFDEQGNLAGSISHQPDFSALQANVFAHAEEIVKGCANIVLEMDMNEAMADHLIALAERYNKKVYVIVGNMGIILKRPDLLTRVDCFICNEIEAGRLFDRDLTVLTPEEMLAFLPEAVRDAHIPSMIVTMGPHGAVYHDSRTDEAGLCPALPCRLVDSTGAGDAFLSGAVTAFTRGLPLKTAVESGIRLATVVIQNDENACPPLPDFFNGHTDL